MKNLIFVLIVAKNLNNFFSYLGLTLVGEGECYEFSTICYNRSYFPCPAQ
jgi:hypothetical protein